MSSEQYFNFSKDTLEFNASNTKDFSLEKLFIEVGDNFNNLELKNFSLDRLEFFKKFQSVKSLVIKDSYIDYKNFYNSLLLLKKVSKNSHTITIVFLTKKNTNTIGVG